MRATLEFELPEDQEEFHTAVRSGETHSVCLDADNQIRSWLKHGHEFKCITDALEACRALLPRSPEDYTQ